MFQHWNYSGELLSLADQGLAVGFGQFVAALAADHHSILGHHHALALGTKFH
jgi:hypothetical protein